jgi:hypothetical protein
MNLFGWNFEIRRARGAARVMDGRLRCEACKGAIHKHEHYTVLSVRHKDCKDPKLVGQRSLRLELREINGTPALMAQAEVREQGTEIREGEAEDEA